MNKSGVANKYGRVAKDMYDDSGVICGGHDRWVQSGGRITSGTDSEPILVFNGDGQVDKLNQTGLFIDI